MASRSTQGEYRMKAEKAVAGTMEYPLESILESLYKLVADGTINWSDAYLRTLYVDNMISGLSWSDEVDRATRDKMQELLVDLQFVQSIMLKREHENDS